MRELTLRHLLLLVGKAIAENEIDSEESLRITTISQTLFITREKRSPYVINWEINGSQRSLEVEDSRFRFHVRGDVPNRNPQNEDVRSTNWAEACSVWSKILGKEVRTDPSQLAPQFFSEISQERFTRAFQIVCFVLSVAIAFLFDQDLGIALIGIFSINECLKLGDSFVRRRFSFLLATSMAVAITTWIPTISPAFIALLALEMITAVLVFSYKETSIISLGLLTSLVVAIVSGELSLRWEPSAVVGFSLFSFLAAASLPYGKSGNLRRISVMFSLSVLFLCANLDLGALWGVALLGALGIFPIKSRKTKVILRNDQDSATPVSIRQSRGL